MIAVLQRCLWAWDRGAGANPGEAYNVATALASGRGYADAYYVGAGPTAHVMPSTPLIAAGINALFGVRSPATEIVLQCLASIEMVAGYLLLFTLFRQLGVARPARIGALGFMCVIPMFLGQESLDFRYWEGGLAVVLMVATLQRILSLDTAGGVAGRADLTVLAALLASTFFVSPVLGIGVALCALILALRRWSWPVRFGAGTLTCAILAALLTPWAIRNDLTLGKPIMTRSNASLELSIANNDHALDPDHGRGFRQSMATFHPFVGQGPKARFKTLGEIAYMVELDRQVSAWVRSHPVDFLLLCGRHARQMLIPEPFQFEIGSGLFSGERALIYAVVAITGIFSIALGIWRGQFGYAYVGIVIATAVVCYAPFQPMARYLYLIYGLLVFTAADLASRIAIKWLSSTRRQAGS